MATIKTLKNIYDTSVKRTRKEGEEFEVTPKRLAEMQTTLKEKFEQYFLINKSKKNEKVNNPN